MKEKRHAKNTPAPSPPPHALQFQVFIFKATRTAASVQSSTLHVVVNTPVAVSPWNDLAQGDAQTAPERRHSVWFIRPLNVGRRVQHRHHGGRQVRTGSDVIDTGDHQRVIVVHDVTEAARQLELAPLAAGEVPGEDHHHLATPHDAVDDVVHDVRAGQKVSLVDAEPQPEAILQFRYEMLTDPKYVLLCVRHEHVVSAESRPPSLLVSSLVF